MTALLMLSTVAPDTAEATYRLTPSGGVRKPNSDNTANMIPICTGSTPSMRRTGWKMGVSKTMVLKVSLNMPTITRKMAIKPWEVQAI